MDELREIFESLRRNKFRTALTGFAVSWGIFILVVLLGSSSGLEHGLMLNLNNTASNSVRLWAGWAQMPCDGLPAFRSTYFSDRELRILQADKHVDKLSPIVTTSQTVKFNNKTASMSVRGVNNDYQEINRLKPLFGRLMRQREVEEEDKVVVLSERAMNELNNGSSSIVGQFVEINGICFRVIGIIKGNNWEGNFALIPISVHQRIYSTDHHFGELVLTVNGSSKGLEDYLRKMLAPLMHFNVEDNNALYVGINEESMEQMQKVVYGLRLFILIVSICTLISGAVGVSNIMLVSVKERTKELGIRKALGAPPSSVMISVIGESFVITAMFGLIGALLGSGVVAIIGKVVPQGENMSVFVNPTVDTFTIVSATIILIIVGVIAGAIPARKAMNIKPIEAMNADK
ncbi:MAG: ABC transporter permease [Paludibacteraceae bacterium]|nr:ABC transporter permease [Paludibacteraceae bacterium]